MKTIKAREVRGFLRISCKKCGRELVSLSRGCDNEKLPYRCLCGDFLDSREIEVAIGNFKSHLIPDEETYFEDFRKKYERERGALV